jgi:hypothetical protein
MRRAVFIPIGHQVGTLLAVCLVLVAGLTVVPPPSLGEQAPSLVLRAPDIPLAAVAVTTPVRMEKQAPGPRTPPHRPERAGRYLPASARVLSPELRAAALHRRYPDLPRRPLLRRQAAPPASGDPSH